MFQLFKVKKLIMEYWLTDNDEVVKSDQMFLREVSVPVSDFVGRDETTVTEASITAFPNHKMKLLIPGKVYKKVLYPKFAVLQGNANNTGSGVGIPKRQNLWNETSAISASALTSANCVAIFWTQPGSASMAETSFITYRIRQIVQFASRRNASAIV